MGAHRSRWLGLGLLLATGCASRLDLSGDDPKVPTATIYYAGVRAGGRRFPDYGSVDRAILKRK